MGEGEAPCDGLKPRNDKELLWLRDVCIQRIQTKTRMAIDFLRREPWAFFEANFFAAHCIGHQCWHFHDTEHPRYDAKVSRKVGDPIRDVYVEMDRGLGQVLEAIESDTTVIVYCSHGMGPNYTATGGFLDKILLSLEGIESPMRTERLISLARNIWRSAPGPLRKQMVKLQARNFEARVQRRIQPAKARRRYFEQHVNGATGCIRVNLEGREGAGIVKPSEYDALLDAITRDMMEIVNEETGKPLVSKIYRSREIYEGPYVDRMPDLLVLWNRDAPIRKVTSPKIGSVPDPNPSMRSGDHRPEGLFAAVGPGLRPTKLDDPVSVVDFAPTIFRLLDVPSVDTDGTPIEALTARPIAIEAN
jgi:predicted AlkP superfamily phosphohydrolase/phosphomutase